MENLINQENLEDIRELIENKIKESITNQNLESNCSEALKWCPTR